MLLIAVLIAVVLSVKLDCDISQSFFLS